MNTDSDTSVDPGSHTPKRARRLQTGVRALIALVACSATILWAWRHLAENYDPVRIEARSIQERAIAALRSGRPAERLAAIVELERLGPQHGSIAIPPLIRALEDPETQVRVVSAGALASIGHEVAKSRSGGGTIRDAATGLNRCLKDPEPTVRIAAIQALGSIASAVAESGSGGEIVRDVATALIGCLKDPEPGVRSAATASLGRIASPRLAGGATLPIDRGAVMDELIAMLGDRDAAVRLAAIQTIASYPREAVRPGRWPRP